MTKRKAKEDLLTRGVKRKFDSVETMQARIEEYFSTGMKTKVVVGKSGFPVTIQVPTITGLCLFLGFEDRNAFNKYEKYPEFESTIKSARSRIESHYEELAQEGNTGAIFALKNFGWRDKQEIETTEKKIDLTADVSDKTAKELKDIFSSLLSQ